MQLSIILLRRMKITAEHCDYRPQEIRRCCELFLGFLLPVISHCPGNNLYPLKSSLKNSHRFLPLNQADSSFLQQTCAPQAEHLLLLGIRGALTHIFLFVFNLQQVQCLGVQSAMGSKYTEWEAVPAQRLCSQRRDCKERPRPLR